MCGGVGSGSVSVVSRVVGRRLAVTDAKRHVVRARLVHASSGSRVGVLVDGALHLLKDLVDLDQIVLGADVGHGRQSVGLVVGVVVVVAINTANRDGSGQVLGSQRAAVAEGTVERHQALANLGIRSRVELATLGLAKELVEDIVGALASLVVGRSLVSDGLLTTAHGLVVHGTSAKGRRRRVVLVVATAVGRVVRRSAKGGGVCAHLAIVVVIARGSLWLGAVAAVEALAVLVGRADEDRVVGVSLDVLLEILGPLEALSAEVALVGLEGHVDADVRGDVVALDGGGAAGGPEALEAEVVCALAADVLLTDVVVEQLGSAKLVGAGAPAAGEVVLGRRGSRDSSGRNDRRVARLRGGRGRGRGRRCVVARVGARVGAGAGAGRGRRQGSGLGLSGCCRRHDCVMCGHV